MSIRRGRTRGDDSGFTLVEITIALLITLIIFGITFSLIVGLQEEEQTAGATVTGAREAQLTTMAVFGYIRAAYAVTAVVGPNPGATTSSFTIDSYIGTSQGALTPNSGQITVTYTGGSLTEQATGWKGSPPSTTATKNSFLINDVTPPNSSTPVFTYYAYEAGAAPGTIEAVSDPARCLGDIVAIGLDLTFGAPNGRLVTQGAIPASGSTLSSTIYLHDVGQAPSAPAGGVC